MNTFSLKGMGVAMITPFDLNTEIDYDALSGMIDYIINGGADYIVVLGTTGESVTLSAEERIIVRRFVVEKVSGRVPLVIGIGGNCTREVTHELTHSDLLGYSAVLSVAPFYNKPSQEGLYQHYKAVIESSPLPVILYNIPGRTGVNISAETTLRLSEEYEKLIGIKEASGNFKQIEIILNKCREGFEVVSGDDSLTYPLMTLGAHGVISVVGNAFPRKFGEMVRLCLAGDFKKALPIHNKFNRLYDELFKDGNPAGIKSLLHDMGKIHNVLRLPLVPTSMHTGEELRKILKELTTERSDDR